MPVKKQKIIVMVGFLCMTIGLSGTIHHTLKIFDESKKYETLHNEIVKATETNFVKDTQNLQAPTKIMGKYEKLKDKNNDMVGWLTVNSDLHYPIMQSQLGADSNYYLYRDFDKKKSISGSIYIPNDITINDSLVLVYGHHMKNGTMFGSLENYLNDDYLKANPTIEFSNLYEDTKFRVVGTFISKIYDDDYSGFKYYDYRGNLTEEQFSEYLSGIKPLMKSGSLSDVSYDDKLIELVTCWYSEKNARLVVLCKAMR